MIFIRILALLRRKKGINRLTGWPRGSGARLPHWSAPQPHGPLEHRLALISLPKNHIYSKKISVRFYPVWTPFDMDILRNKKHATNRNWHWALDQYVSPQNNINVAKSIYWHGQSKIIDMMKAYQSPLKLN